MPPTTADARMSVTVNWIACGQMPGCLGVLTGGTAVASLQPTPGMLASVVGATLTFSAIVVDPVAGFVTASNPARVRIVP